jgi:hypothetical protein
VADRIRRGILLSVNEEWKKMLENAVKKLEDTSPLTRYATQLSSPLVRRRSLALAHSINTKRGRGIHLLSAQCHSRHIVIFEMNG